MQLFIDSANPKEILAMVPANVSLEVLATEAPKMVAEARQLSALGKNVVVKLPATEEGLKALKVVKKEGIPTNMTLVFSPNQALLAAKLGATMVSPFVGRLDDIGASGTEVVEEIRQIYDNYA